MPTPRRSPRSSSARAPQRPRCAYVSPTGERCRRIATVGNICEPCSEELQSAISDDVWAGLANGSISFGDVISKAAGKFVGDLFNGSPTMRDLGRAVQDAARQSQAANAGRPRTPARVVPNVPPPRQAPRPPPRQPPRAETQQGWQSQWGSPPGSQQQQQRRPPPPPRGPGPDQRAEASRTLGLDPRGQHTEQAIAARRKSLAKTWHPDRPGGNEAMMMKINAAADLLIAQLGKPGW